MAYHGSDNQELRLFRISQDLIDDLLWRLLKDLFSGRWVVRLANSRKKDPQIVINLGGGCDRRARVRYGSALLDRDGRR